MDATTIAVIGAGNIGGTLARKWAAAGHRVVLGVRDPSGPRASRLVEELGPAISAAGMADAANAAGIVVFAVPGAAMAATLGDLRAALRGKLIVDATNTLTGDGPSNSLGLISRAVPTAVTYRAFNSLGWEILADPVIDDVRSDLFFAGPDGPGRQAVASLIQEAGLRPVWLGGPERADLVDAAAAIYFALVTGPHRSRRLAFHVLGF